MTRACLMNALAIGLRAARTARGEAIIYEQGETKIRLTAIPRQPECLVDPAGQPVQTSHEDLDWSILAADLVDGGRQVIPKRGDRILRSDHGNEAYEVLPRAGLECWAWAEGQKTLMRVRTKRAGA